MEIFWQVFEAFSIKFNDKNNLNFQASCYVDNPKCLAEEKVCYHMNSICCYRETQVVPILSVPQYIFDSPQQLPNTITRKPSRIVYANECIFKKPLQMYCKPYRAPNTPKNKCEFGEKLCIIRKFKQTCCYKELNYQSYGSIQTVSVQKIGFKMYCFESATGRKCPGNYQVLYTPFGISCCYRKNEEKSLTPPIPSSIWSSLKSVFTLVDLCYANPIHCENFFFSVKVPGIDVWCCVSVAISGPTNSTIEETASQSQEISPSTNVQSTTGTPYYFCNTTSTTTEKTFDPYDLIDIRNISN